MQSHIIINTRLNLIISDFSDSPELNLFNESNEIEYDRARIKIDIKAFVISYVLAPTLYGGHSGYFIATLVGRGKEFARAVRRSRPRKWWCGIEELTTGRSG